MLYKDICVIGLGTIGGFLSYNLYNSKISNRLILFDYDTVEKENLKNTIFTHKSIGKSKSKSIHEMMDYSPDVVVRNEKFIEGKTELPECDLIIDCRDFVYDRKDTIDARFYISSRALVIDCRKNIKNEMHHEGKYLNQISKIDASNAAMNATILITNGVIKELIKKELVHVIQLDNSIIETKQLIYNNQNKSDLVYDFNIFEKKIINLHNNYKSIIKTNQNEDLTLFYGIKSNPYISKTIPKSRFKTINDIIFECSVIVNSIPQCYNSYNLSLQNDYGNYFLEILPETGGA